MILEDNERWLSDGDCSKCRKSEYCSKNCTARKKRITQEMTDFIMGKTGIRTFMNEIEKNNDRWE